MTRFFPPIFINYRDSDEPWAAAALDDALTERLGREAVFLDSRSIVIGQWFDEELRANLCHSSVLLVVIGARWLTVTDVYGRRLIDRPQDWVRMEISEAFALRIHVVPVLVGDLPILDPAALPPSIRQLARCQYLRLHHRHRHQNLDQLVQNLLAWDPGLAS
jgi:hypothetical protein